MKDAHQRLIVAKALEIGAILNSIEDDDERELLQERYEQTLNDELVRGSQIRRQLLQAEGLLTAVVGLTPRLRRTGDLD